jgi:hypothetical protein
MIMRASYKINDWHNVYVTDDFRDERSAKLAVLNAAITGELDEGKRAKFIDENIDRVTVEVLE